MPSLLFFASMRADCSFISPVLGSTSPEYLPFPSFIFLQRHQVALGVDET